MEELLAGLEQAFRDYRDALEDYERRRKPTDGLLGFGHSLQHEPCHEHLDAQIRQAVENLCALRPASAEAAKALCLLLAREDAPAWPNAAQWMLRAVERHALPLIPFLSSTDSAALLKRYADRYKPWDRLPAQREVYKALKARADGADP